MSECALDAGEKMLNEMNKYFGYMYSNKKIDQIGVPGLSSGAMENYGLVTYEYVEYKLCVSEFIKIKLIFTNLTEIQHCILTIKFKAVTIV